jgi:hypothetical protein
MASLMNEWSNGGMILTGQNRSTEKKTCVGTACSIANPAWSGLGLNLELCGERLATDCTNHGTIQLYSYTHTHARTHVRRDKSKLLHHKRK